MFPYAASAASWLAGRVAPAWFALGFWRIARSPFHSAWTVLLIALVVGAAIITGTLASTLQRSQEERILYETATDLRVIAPEGGSQAGRQLAERLRAMPGARLGSTIMPYLVNSGEGIDVVPPMILQIDWSSFAIAFGLLGGVLAAAIAFVLYAVYRMSIHSAMRLGG